MVTRTAVLVSTTVALAGCTSGAVVNTGDTPQQTAPPTTSSVPQFGTAHLVNAADYASAVDGRTAYYFSTPSGRWQCAILPRDRAGCESANGLDSGIGITGAPDVIVDGEPTTPNAIMVDRDHDAALVVLPQTQFSLDNAAVLPFGKVLAVAGFRCNVQEETGVSCVRELTGKGFTFSGDGYTLQYTDVP